MARWTLLRSTSNPCAAATYADPTSASPRPSTWANFQTVSSCRRGDCNVAPTTHRPVIRNDEETGRARPSPSPAFGTHGRTLRPSTTIPVILNPGDYERWLTRKDARPPLHLLRSYDNASRFLQPGYGNDSVQNGPFGPERVGHLLGRGKPNNAERSTKL